MFTTNNLWSMILYCTVVFDSICPNCKLKVQRDRIFKCPQNKGKLLPYLKLLIKCGITVLLFRPQMVVVSISKDILHKAVCFLKQTPLFSQQPLVVWCSLNNKCVRMYVFALSKGSEKIRAKVLKYFKTCKVRLNTLS